MAFVLGGAPYVLDPAQVTSLEGAYGDLATSFITNFITVLVAAIPVLVVYGIFKGIQKWLKG
jgi:hypothetical protein